MKPVFSRFHSVVLTSATLSPLTLYPRLLDFHPVVQKRLAMSMPFGQSCICPLVVTRGSDQVRIMSSSLLIIQHQQSAISSKFTVRDDDSVIRNYGDLVVRLSQVVPDGMACFFTSYEYMERVVARWDQMNVIRKLLEQKLVFIETKDVVETTLALDNFRKACDCGRGAVRNPL